MCACHHMCAVPVEAKKVMGSLDLQLQMVVSCCVRAED